MPDRSAALPTVPKRIGVAADHGGFALKEYLVGMLRRAGYEVLDFGDGDAYRDHGDPKARLEQDVEQAGRVLERLPEFRISIDKVTQQLEGEGVEKFNKPFDKLMETLAKR
jgi:transaldolase